MFALADWPLEARRGLLGLFTDIDDTLTTHGAITPDALQALADLRAAGLHVVAITGRSAGWSEPFAAAWPVDAIVAENGAVALIPSSEEGRPAAGPPQGRLRPLGGQRRHEVPSVGATERAPAGRSVLSKRYRQEAATRAANQARMQAVLLRIEREIAGARRAADSPGRECDIAIDHGEFTQLGEARIAAVLALMHSEGMHASVSSIHINGWYGEHDKLAGARWIVRELWRRTLDDEIDRWACVGDSTNDQTMFAAFAHSIGVANIARFVPQLAHLPRYVTQGERGAGFAEVARAVLGSRRAR